MKNTALHWLICCIMATGIGASSYAEVNGATTTLEQKKEADKWAFDQATAAGTDAALIEYLKTSNTSNFDQMAVDKLRSYKTVPNETLIKWSNIPSVHAHGSATSDNETYPCGINMSAFNRRVDEEYIGTSLIIGPFRFYKPESGKLIFQYWTFFDDYLVKGVALVKLNGLFFMKDSVVLKKKISRK